jgi:hypothetical protein
LKYFDNNDILNQYYLIEQNKAQHTIKTLLHQYFLYNDSLKLLYKHKNKLKTSLNDTTTRIMNGVDTTYSIFRIQKQLIDIEEQIQMNLKSQGETLLSLNKPYLVWYYTIQVLGNSTPQPQLNNNPKNITPYIPSHMNGNIL